MGVENLSWLLPQRRDFLAVFKKQKRFKFDESDDRVSEFLNIQSSLSYFSEALVYFSKLQKLLM